MLYFGMVLNVWKVLYKEERGLFQLDLVMCLSLLQVPSEYGVNSEQNGWVASLALDSSKFGEDR